MRARFAIHLLAVIVMALSGGCGRSTTSPGSGGYDPSKPIGRDNLPVCTGNCALAKAEFAVYEGDCVSDVNTCGKKLEATTDSSLWYEGRPNTYLLKNHQQKYTVHLWVTHSGVNGRTVLIGAQALISSVNPPLFLEQNQPSPVHVAVAFNMTLPGGGVTNTGSGQVEFHEGAWDLSFSHNDWKVALGFRVQS